MALRLALSFILTGVVCVIVFFTVLFLDEQVDRARERAASNDPQNVLTIHLEEEPVVTLPLKDQMEVLSPQDPNRMSARQFYSGLQWARQFRLTDPALCMQGPPDFRAGCLSYLEEHSG